MAEAENLVVKSPSLKSVIVSQSPLDIFFGKNDLSVWARPGLIPLAFFHPPCSPFRIRVDLRAKATAFDALTYLCGAKPKESQSGGRYR